MPIPMDKIASLNTSYFKYRLDHIRRSSPKWDELWLAVLFELLNAKNV